MTEERNEMQQKGVPESKNTGTQRRLLGLPEQGDDMPENVAVNNNLVESAWSGCGPAAAGIDFSDAAQADGDAKRAWGNLLNDPGSNGFFNTFRESIGESAKIRLKAIDEPSSTAGDATPQIRQDLRHLRIREGKDGANDYLTPEMRKFDGAFIAVGEKPTIRPSGFSNEYLATIELARMAGRSPATDTDERDILQTIVSENLREYFPFSQPWTAASPWDDAQKELAASRMQLVGTKAQRLAEVERYHNRFLAATIFAETNEKGRPYGVQTNRATLNQFILDHVGDDLRVTGGGAWTAAAKRDFCRKYEVTNEEAEQMRKRVLDIQAGKVF